MANKKIVLAAGHYYETPGKRTPDGVREWTLNNAVCNFIAEYLKDYNVEITRVDDTTGKTAITLAERVKKTNKINPDAFVSIHHNAYNGKWNNVTGVEVYSHTYGTNEDKKLAKLLAPKISKETGLKNRGAKTAQFEVLTCKATIPAVLCEGGFMDSKIDNPVITSEKGQRAYAKAVADGIIEYLKLKKNEVVKEETEKIPNESEPEVTDTNVGTVTESSAEDKTENVETKPIVDNTSAEEETKPAEYTANLSENQSTQKSTLQKIIDMIIDFIISLFK